MHCYHLGDYCKEEFPVAAWQVRKAGVIPLHRHDCVELMLVTRGSGVCRINGSPYPVLSGDLFVLCSEDLHSYEMEPECVFYNILFDPAFFASDPELAALFDKMAHVLHMEMDDKLRPAPGALEHNAPLLEQQAASAQRMRI